MSAQAFSIDLSNLTEDEAMALAQLCKRFGFSHAEELANSCDGGREQEHMISAVAKLRRALAEEGFAPR